MDLRDEQIDYSSDSSLVGNENIILKKSQSEINLIERKGSTITQFDNEPTDNQISLKLDKLKIDNKEYNFNQEDILLTQETQTCQCEKCLEECKKLTIQSRDVFTSELINQGLEILDHQGVKHLPIEVSSCFKKDSRMWLWKQSHYTKKLNK